MAIRYAASILAHRSWRARHLTMKLGPVKTVATEPHQRTLNVLQMAFAKLDHETSCQKVQIDTA